MADTSTSIPSVFKTIGKERHWCCGAGGCKGKLAKLHLTTSEMYCLKLRPDYDLRNNGVYAPSKRAAYRFEHGRFDEDCGPAGLKRLFGEDRVLNGRRLGKSIYIQDLPVLVRCPSCSKVGKIASIGVNSSLCA